MEVLFIGVGEACDERLPNTSVLIRTERDGLKRSVLLDCGFTTGHLFWKYVEDPDELDGLWVSHFHGDHFFGAPALLLRFWEMKRQKPLRILGQPGVERVVQDAMDLAYPGFLQKLTYSLEFTEMEPDGPVEAVGFTWRCAENGHSRRDLAVRIEDGRASVFYSGDGSPTAETSALAAGCDLIIHEAFYLEQAGTGHGSVSDTIEFASKAGASVLALVHVQRDVRRLHHREIVKLLDGAQGFRAVLPEPGDVLGI